LIFVFLLALPLLFVVVIDVENNFFDDKVRVRVSLATVIMNLSLLKDSSDDFLAISVRNDLSDHKQGT